MFVSPVKIVLAVALNKNRVAELRFGFLSRTFAGFQEAVLSVPSAQLPVSALNDEFPAADKSLRNFSACGLTDFCGGCSGNIHLHCTLAVGQALVIYKAQSFVFIHCEEDGFFRFSPGRSRGRRGHISPDRRHVAYTPASLRSCHKNTSVAAFIFDISRL
jgi:hypothetical protein